MTSNRPRRTALHAPAIAAVGSTVVQQANRRDLVRHGDERATDVGKLENCAQKIRIVLGPAPHGYDNGINPGILEPGVVDHRCLECVRREADVSDDLGVAVDGKACHFFLLFIAFAAFAVFAALTPARSASK